MSSSLFPQNSHISRSEYASSPPRKYSSLYGESTSKKGVLSVTMLSSNEEDKSELTLNQSSSLETESKKSVGTVRSSSPRSPRVCSNFKTKITLRKKIPDNQNPPKRKGHTLTEWKNKLYLFGGYQGFHSNDLWILDANKWKKVEVQGVLPHKRSSHSAVIYKNHLVIFGGDKGNELLNDIWILDLAKEAEDMRWKKIVSKNTPPKPRYAHNAVIMNEKMILFGGYGGEYLNDMFEFDFKTLMWSQIHTFLSPPARCHFSLVAFSENNNLPNILVMYGGSNGESLNDVWVFDGNWICIQKPKDTSWLNNETPSPRSKHAAVKISSNTMIVYGEWWDYLRTTFFGLSLF
ncbi:hypothetical protein C9374_010287 [Naegleria lovaniensis]|uniref:Kelch repeat-containing protein n=1 Tax=Naegleria lovaniensis TaxID=51637 RepID=A0AA88KED1_NAELO|nr:uncharacterized protein C9374_010287 [Naegleria lovaniensis]KAG2374913.1 hypothetical protein C9374_010287 [Naegleria lovaniensis]